MTSKRTSAIVLLSAYAALVSFSWLTVQRPNDNFPVFLAATSVAWLTYCCVNYVKRYAA